MDSEKSVEFRMLNRERCLGSWPLEGEEGSRMGDSEGSGGNASLAASASSTGNPGANSPSEGS